MSDLKLECILLLLVALIVAVPIVFKIGLMYEGLISLFAAVALVSFIVGFCVSVIIRRR